MGIELAEQLTFHHSREIVSLIALVSANDGRTLLLPFPTSSFSPVIASYCALCPNSSTTQEVKFRGFKRMMADVWVHMFAELRKEQSHCVLEDNAIC